MLDQIPQDLLINGVVFDPAIAGGQFVREIERRKRAAGKTDQEIKDTVIGIEENSLRRDYAVNKYRLSGTYTVSKFLDKDFKNIKFDVIVGNPPYQDGSKEGGQNKIYNQICKKAISLLKPTGVLAFVTPTSVLQKSKRFSLVNQSGLKLVDFTADSFFKVGIKICWWLIDKSHTGNISVMLSNKETMTCNKGKSIHDANESNIDTLPLYNFIVDSYSGVENKEKRMFQRYTHAGAFSKVTDSTYRYPIVSNARGVKKTVYGKTKPLHPSERKLYVSNTKALTDASIFIDTRNYGPSFFYVVIDDDSEIENIKSFVTSKYFIDLYTSFRLIRGGMNSVIIDFCPVFDKTKLWTDEEVKEFFEGLVDS
jgi:hypothetical protein